MCRRGGGRGGVGLGMAQCLPTVRKAQGTFCLAKGKNGLKKHIPMKPQPQNKTEMCERWVWCCSACSPSFLGS